MAENKFLEALKDLEETVEKLNNPDLNIDEAILLHEKGVKQYGVCEHILDEAQQKIEIYKKEQ